MGCAKSKPSSDDELQRRNGPATRAPPPQPSPPPPPPPPPPKNVNQNQPEEAPPSTTALMADIGATMALIDTGGENKEKSLSESTVSSSERIIEAPVIPPPITPKRNEPPANINAARDDDGPSVGAILVLGALSGIAVESAVSYLSSDGSKQVKAPPPKKTCDNPNGCGPCTITKVKDLRYSFASRRYLWVESHEDHVSVHATPGKDSTVDARVHFNAEGGFNPTSNNNNKLAKDNDDKAQEGVNPTSNNSKLSKANDDNAEGVNPTSNNDNEPAKENDDDAEEGVKSTNDQSNETG